MLQLVVLLFFTGNSLFSLLPPGGEGRLIIEIDRVERAQGTIWVGIYNSESTYLIKEKAIIKEVPVFRKGSAIVEVDNLPYGTYAVALFHDLNDNDTLDQNFFGIPTEPYAFSRPPSSKWRLPYFREVAFPFRSRSKKLRTSLRNWNQ